VSETTRFHDLRRADFPFTIEFWARTADRDGPPTWSVTITEPGATRVPKLGPGTWTRITYPDRVVTVPPPT
jgi:hypothetical protein